MRHGRRWVGALAACTLVTGVGAVATADDRPPMDVVTSFGPGDGLRRWVVTLAVDAPAATAATAARSDSSAPTARAAHSAEARVVGAAGGLRIDVARLAAAQAALGPGGRTVQDGTRVHYVTATDRADITDSGSAPTVSAPAGAAATGSAPTGSAHAGAAATGSAPTGTASGAERDAALAALAAHPGVASAQYVGEAEEQVLVATRLDRAAVDALPEVDAVLDVRSEGTALGTITDPYWASFGWNLENTGSNALQQTALAGADVDAATGWDATRGQGTVIAVVDTGFDSDHPDLVGSLWNNPSEACGAGDQNGNGLVGDCHGWNFYANTADVDNGAGGGHGTSVAGTAAARADNGHGVAGVAPQATIMPLVVGHGQSIDMLLAAKAIRYAADNGATVVNGSFGSTSLSPGVVAELSSAIDYAYAKGVLVVVAAGNDHLDRDTSTAWPASMANPGLVVVGSSDARDGVASHSAYGRTSVDLFTPGELVVTTMNDGGYAGVSGTSIASPHVAAAVAMYRSANLTLSAAQIKTRLLADATRLPVLTDRSVSGGRLSVARVAAAVGEATSYRFGSMVAPPGAQAPTATVTSTAGAGTYAAVVGLAMLVDGEIWAVADEDVTLDGQTLTTDDRGQVTFPLGSRTHLGERTLSLGTTLGEGSFGLTVQVLRDGVPLTRPYAAPLLVTSTPPADLPDDVPDETGEQTPDGPGAPAPGGTAPAPGGTSPAPGGTTPPGGTGPGGSTPVPGDPGPAPNGPAPLPVPGGTSPSDPAPGSTPAPGTGPEGAAPGDDAGSPDPAPDGPDPAPGVGTPVPGTGSGPEPSGPGEDGSAQPTDPGVPDERTYDGVGAFRATRISPVHVSTAGGELVRVTAEALEAGVGVRVGATRIAQVVATTATSLTFVAPSAVAGTYDVTLFKNGRTSVLADALVYGDGEPPAGGGSVPPSTPDGTDPGTEEPTAPGPAPGGSGEGPGGSAPAPGDGPGGEPGDEPGNGPDDEPGPGATPTQPRATRTGPNGERLVRYDALASLSGLWGVTCRTTCDGMQA